MRLMLLQYIILNNSIGIRMDSSEIWEKIARALGTEITRTTVSAIWPIASALLSQLHENPCDYFLIIHSVADELLFR